jgi:hypothetical protein
LNEFNPVVRIIIFYFYVFIFIYFYPFIMIFCYIMHILNIVVDRCEYKCGIETYNDWVGN